MVRVLLSILLPDENRFKVPFQVIPSCVLWEARVGQLLLAVATFLLESEFLSPIQCHQYERHTPPVDIPRKQVVKKQMQITSQSDKRIKQAG